IPPPMSDRTVLIIDSDEAFGRRLAEILRPYGFRAELTGDGNQGLAMAKDLVPQLILLAVELPKMSGYSICNKLKKSSDLKDIPLVIMSSEATPETFEQHKKLKTRAEEYLIKPCAPAELLGKVGSVLTLGAAEGGDIEEDVEVSFPGVDEARTSIA